MPRDANGLLWIDATEAIEGRRVLLNEGWRFRLGEAAGAERVDYADADWREVELPHDWSIELPFSPECASATGYLPGGVGWYRLRFALPAELAGKSLRVCFGGIYNNSEVLWNGRSLGKRPYGYTTFLHDLTEGARFGGEPNLLAVRVDRTRVNDSRWYPGSGITRDAHLVVTEPVHVADWGVSVTTPEVTRERARVRVVTAVRNDANGPATVTVVTRIVDRGGKERARATCEVSLAPGAETETDQNVAVTEPLLWSLQDPALYTARTELLVGGAAVDRTETRFGIRTFAFDREAGFSLNGTGMKLKGVCVHHDAGVLGAAVPRKVWQRRLDILMDLGCNAVRMSHNPPDEALLDLCDELGLLAIDEAFDEWTRGKRKWVDGWNRTVATTDGYHEAFEEWSERDLRAMVLRDRNHPSIVLWSIGNEIDYPDDPYPPYSEELPPIAERLARVVRELDPTRPVTAALAAPVTCLFADSLDVVGYNYMEHLYREHHEQHPERTIIGSENKHSLEDWLAVERNGFIASQFLWTGIDHLGEAGPWPNRGARCGLLDLAGFRKPTAYWRESLWAEWPVLFLHRERGELICYTNCETVELLHGEQSLGEQPLPPDRVIRWPAPVQTAALVAVGKRGGKPIARHAIPRAAPVSRLRVLADSGCVVADGRDLAHVEVYLVDAAGEVVAGDPRVVQVDVSGPGRLLGLESGDQESHEDYRSNRRQTYGGRLLAYVQSRREPGEIEVTVSSEGLHPVAVTIASEKGRV
jgi:beta-galactosidase